MKRLVHKLSEWVKRLGYRTPAAPVYVASIPLPPVAHDLDAHEVEDWKLILATPLGQKVQDKIRAMHYMMMTATTIQPTGVTERAYLAQGFAECYRYIVSLGHIQVPPEKPKPESDEDAENIVWEERVSP